MRHGFDLDDARGLGPAPNDDEWTVLGGRWRVEDGQAVLADEPDGADDVPSALAVYDPDAVDLRAQVRLTSLTLGAGLVFWARDADNYLILAASPGYSTFFLAEVRDGQRRTLRSTGLTSIDGDEATVGVHLVGRTVEVLVNGVVIFSRAVKPEAASGGIGLGRLPGTGGASFDDIVVKPDSLAGS